MIRDPYIKTTYNRILGGSPHYSLISPLESPSMFNSLSNYSNYFKLDQTTPGPRHQRQRRRCF